MKKMVIVFLLIMMVFLAGCTMTSTAGQDTGRDTIRVHYELHDDWSVGLGCYNKVSGYAFNAGNTSVDNVALNFNLVDDRTGTIRDSRSVFFGTMEAGQSGTFESLLDGECSQQYQVKATIIKII